MSGGIFLAILVVRILASFANANAGTTSGNTRFFHWLGASARWVLAGIALILFAEHVYVLVIPCLLFAYPTPLIEHVLVPLGAPWLSFFATRTFRPPGVGDENVAAAFLFELRARLRFGLLLNHAWLERYSVGLFVGKSWGPRGATLSARALLLALAGDIESARAYFSVAMNMDRTPRAVRAFSQAFLLAEAAARGDYAAVRRWSRAGPRTRRARFMDACATVLLGENAAAPRKLWLLWVLAPNRRENLGLLRLALSAPPAPSPRPISSDLASVRDASIELLVGSSTRQRIRELAAAWEKVLESRTLDERLSTRLLQLDASAETPTLLLSLEEQVVALLADAWQRATADELSVDVGRHPRLLGTAIDIVRSRLLDELESQVETLPLDKARWTDDLEANHRRWAEVRYVAERFLWLFPQEGETLYDLVGTHLLNHGVWVNNTEFAYPLSRDIFLWLSEVIPQGHPSQELLRSNARIAKRQMEF